MSAPDDATEPHPVQNAAGTWDALDANGWGYSLGYSTAAEVEIWLRGYDTGARENM